MRMFAVKWFLPLSGASLAVCVGLCAGNSVHLLRTGSWILSIIYVELMQKCIQKSDVEIRDFDTYGKIILK